MKSSDGNAIGIVGDFLVVCRGRADLQGSRRRLRRANRWPASDTYSKAISAQSDGSLADVYVDIGGLIKQSGGAIDPQARQVFQTAGIDPNEATAVASVVPGSDQVEIDLSSDVAGDEAPDRRRRRRCSSPSRPTRSPRFASPASARA